MPNTYERLTTITSTGSQTILSATNLSQSYTHLRCIGWLASNQTTGFLYVSFNNDNQARYSANIIQVDNGSNAVQNQTNGAQTYLVPTNSANGGQVNTASNKGMTLFILDIPFYTAPVTATVGTYKYYTGTYCIHGTYSYQSSGAITRADLTLSGSNTFLSGSTWSIYGYTKA
jgi:hypothetical protein